MFVYVRFNTGVALCGRGLLLGLFAVGLFARGTALFGFGFLNGWFDFAFIGPSRFSPWLPTKMPKTPKTLALWLSPFSP